MKIKKLPPSMSSKKPRVRLYADENIPIPTTIYLKSKGISVIHAYDKNFIEKPDLFHLKQSKNLARILISLDKDFKKFKGFSLKNHPGVILISVGNITPNHINIVLEKILNNISSEFVKESLIKATIDKIIKEKGNVLTEKFI